MGSGSTDCTDKYQVVVTADAMTDHIVGHVQRCFSMSSDSCVMTLFSPTWFFLPSLVTNCVVFHFNPVQSAASELRLWFSFQARLKVVKSGQKNSHKPSIQCLFLQSEPVPYCSQNQCLLAVRTNTFSQSEPIPYCSQYQYLLAVRTNGFLQSEPMPSCGQY